MSVLSNGLLASFCRDATWSLWQQGAVLVGDQLARLVAGYTCWAGKSSRQDLETAKTLYGLISNLQSCRSACRRVLGWGQGCCTRDQVISISCPLVHSQRICRCVDGLLLAELMAQPQEQVQMCCPAEHPAVNIHMYTHTALQSCPSINHSSRAVLHTILLEGHLPGGSCPEMFRAPVS